MLSTITSGARRVLPELSLMTLIDEGLAGVREAERNVRGWTEQDRGRTSVTLL